jgi:DNA repair exonuclease SbcCD nuclease subunit
VPLKLLRDKGIDYLALGHEHSFRLEALDGRGVWAYAGCPEGRGFDECGEKGCVLLDTDAPSEARVTFLKLNDRTLHELSVSLDGCASFGDVLHRVEAAIADIPSRDMVKIVLRGALPPEVVRDPVHLRKMLNERFYFARVKDECRLLVRPEDYLGDISLKGEFIRTVLASSLTDEQKQRTIECGLRALRGEEVDA